MFSTRRCLGLLLTACITSAVHTLVAGAQPLASSTPIAAPRGGEPATPLGVTAPRRTQSGTDAARSPRRGRARASKSRAATPSAPSERVVRAPAPFAALRQGMEARQRRGGEKWNYHAAYLYWLQQRAYPRSDVVWNAYARAFTRRGRMSGVRFSGLKSATTPPPRWEFIGPRNLPVPYQQYYGQGMVSGRVNGVAFDPNNPQVIYVASAGGGFWKSTDGGQKDWTCLSDTWENVKFSSVAVHPTNSNIIAVGTGDYAGALGYGFGVMMTSDGGETWTNVLRDELRWYSVSQILFDPDDPRIITVTAGRHPQNMGKILRSTDGGRTWSPAITKAGPRVDWINVQVGAKGADGKRYYYAAGVHSWSRYARPDLRHNRGECEKGQLWLSEDSGQRWRQLAGPPAGTCMEMMDVAPSPSSPRKVYLATRDFDKGLGQVWVSNDAGGRWDDTTNNFPHHEDTVERDGYNWSQAGYDFYIKCSRHPLTGADVIYVGLIDLVASTDGGKNWQSVGRTYHPDAKTHNDQHALAFNPRDPNSMLVGNDGGVYHLTYKPSKDPAKDSWVFLNNLNAGLGMTMFYRIAVNPSDPDWVIGGTQDNATPVSMGNLGQWSNRGKGDGGFCAINPQNPRVQYATSQDLWIYKTDDGWASSQSITPLEVVSEGGRRVNKNWGSDRRGFIAPIALSPSEPKRLYAGTNYLWRWDDDTGEWSRRLGNQVLASGDGYVNFIAVAPGDSDRIYTGSNVGDIWMTTNGGADWERIDNYRLPGATPSLPVTSIAVHPNNPDSILVGFGSTEAYAHLWRCDNTRAGDIRWTPLSGAGANALPSIPLNAIAIDPRSPDTTYYVGTDVGVFLSNDRGATWANFGTPLGLPNVQVTDLHLVPDSRRLVAATFGRGAWRIDLPEGARPLYFKPATVPGTDSGRTRRLRRLR